jgi:hypothetical protein
MPTILVKNHPLFSQIVEVDGISNARPFEQTSSVTYPNILVLDYMKATKQLTPEIQMKAEGFVNTGYQRLLSFEVNGGGFEWFGNPPANQILTAYGLMEFKDMSKVHEVDPAVISRTQKWLISRQQGDGSWAPDQAYLHQESWGRIQNSNLPVTAYATWALLESGYDGAEMRKAVDYVSLSPFARMPSARDKKMMRRAQILVEKGLGDDAIIGNQNNLCLVRNSADMTLRWPLLRYSGGPVSPMSSR